VERHGVIRTGREDTDVAMTAGDGVWRKSSRCYANNCVEISGTGDTVRIRRTENSETVATVEFSREEWIVFADALHRGEFDDLAATGP
jgi:Domain of unknown function (DUF397)